MSSDLGEFVLIRELKKLLEDKQFSSVGRLINHFWSDIFCEFVCHLHVFSCQNSHLDASFVL